MPKIPYTYYEPHRAQKALIEHANVILVEFEQQGYQLTLRQLYYQFVARDIIENTERSYYRLQELIVKARMGGYIDWNHITDRTRNIEKMSAWDSPQQIIEAVANQYRIDMWADQPKYVEVWVEKDALKDVIGQVSRRWNVPYFSCRGYTSISEIWSGAQRMLAKETDGKETVVIHLGDHDPSGIDMSRDIGDRMATFGARTKVIRIALNMNQIRQYSPPPNPAKATDSRYGAYREEYGDESWELDALAPQVIDALIETQIGRHLDESLWAESKARQEAEREELTAAADNWPELISFMTREGILDRPEDTEDEDI